MCTIVAYGKWQSDHYIQVNFAEKYKPTENFGKLFGDSNKQGDRSHKTVYSGLTVSCFKVLQKKLLELLNRRSEESGSNWSESCDRSAVCPLFWKVYSVDAIQNRIHTTLLQHMFKFYKKQTSPINANEKKKPKLDHNINGTGSRFSACMLIYQNAIFLLRHAVSSMQTTWSCHKEPICTLSWQSLDQLMCK